MQARTARVPAAELPGTSGVALVVPTCLTMGHRQGAEATLVAASLPPLMITDISSGRARWGEKSADLSLYFVTDPH